MNASQRSALLLLVALALAPSAPSAAAAADPDVPRGAVALFNLASCPSGWTPPAYAAGRLLLVTTDAARVGIQTGTPLSNLEDRQHEHTYEASVIVNHRRIAGADSCCNDSAAEAKTYSFSGTTKPVTTRLPFIQLTVCEKR